MLCANLIYSDQVTHILTHLNKYFTCTNYDDTLIIRIDLVIADVHSINYQAETQNSGWFLTGLRIKYEC